MKQIIRRSFSEDNRIDPTVLAPDQTSDVGRRTGAMSREVFYGRTDGRTADGGQKETKQLHFRVAPKKPALLLKI